MAFDDQMSTNLEERYLTVYPDTVKPHEGREWEKNKQISSHHIG